MNAAQDHHFDYIFAGAGLAALMTVYKMILSGNFSDKTILILDENPKKTNDRTWCFWSEKDSIWDAVVSKKWDSAWFANANFDRSLALQPYRYNRIRGIDFYNQLLHLIAKQENILFSTQKVTAIEETEHRIFVKSTANSYTCDRLFNSIYNPITAENQSKYPVLQQHFVGWFIKSEEAVFNPEQATFMDFSVAQKGNTRFMYVLPTSKTEALVEYTLFSHHHLEMIEYETEIQKYLEKLGITSYEITEKECGSIPMTCFPFWKKNTQKVLHIGTAGGWTKASTGYTFKNADKKSSALVSFLQTETDFRTFHKKTKFWFYDLIFLDVLDKNNELGSGVFSALFQKGNPALIFKFLDEETTVLEDLRVILKCPKKPFIRAFLRILFRF
ncbi:lycopene cyclase family protein [Flavobacterium restrictum]|uniref:Lycopene cyclase n=1 Tax=Flavobacterium restrictum TaxID=2594428 RepID=A0A553DT74_9FLAO|nr:lycopene cyclase family protein [Flavobacterium restrictum]TRX35987.1 lycopene cyclase [Flavobacterium restrictum]